LTVFSYRQYGLLVDRPLLLQNNAARENNWLGIKLEGTQCNRDAVSARINWTVGGKKWSRLKNNGGSFLSSHDPREVLGLGSATKIDALEIHWPAPSKQIDKVTNLAINRYVRIVEGKMDHLIRPLRAACNSTILLVVPMSTIISISPALPQR